MVTLEVFGIVQGCSCLLKFGFWHPDSESAGLSVEGVSEEVGIGEFSI